MTGKVVRIIEDKGFGFIKSEDGREYFFHRSALKNLDFGAIRTGQAVEFEERPGQQNKGPRAEEIYA